MSSKPRAPRTKSVAVTNESVVTSDTQPTLSAVSAVPSVSVVPSVVDTPAVGPAVSAPDTVISAPDASSVSDAVADAPTDVEKKVKSKHEHCINPARVRTHIDKFNLNYLADSMIAELKAALVACGEASPDTKMLSDKITAISRERVRFSNDASVVLSIICDEIIRQLLRFAMDRTIEANKRNTTIHALYSPGVEQLTLYPLVKSLATFASRKEMFDKQFQETLLKSEISAAVSNAEKELKKLHDIKTPRKRKVEAEVAEVPPSVVATKVVAEDVEVSSKTSFKTYVKHVYNSVKEDEKYKQLFLSFEFKNYLSELLVELIKRLSTLVYLTTTTMKNKTVNDVAILKTVESLMIDTHDPVETIVLKREEVSGVEVWSAVKTIGYPKSGYAELFDQVKKKRDTIPVDELVDEVAC
jgi:hypothetical protein